MIGKIFARRALALSLASFAAPVWALDFFGYAGVNCGHDDPFDAEVKTNYSDEVAEFTNVNQVCLPEDPAIWAEKIQRAAEQYDPLLSVEPLFDFAGDGPDGETSRALMSQFRQALAESGVPPERIIFYLADEPTLRGLPRARIERAGEIVHETWPGARTMLVEAFDPDGPPSIPASVDLWGFDAYGIAHPLADIPYRTFLTLARLRLRDDQRIVLILDANHTPYHVQQGLTEADMAKVARAYHAFALIQPDIAGMIGYLWAGGVDNPEEKGVRDLPPEVRAAHEKIGRAIVGSK